METRSVKYLSKCRAALRLSVFALAAAAVCLAPFAGAAQAAPQAAVSRWVTDDFSTNTGLWTYVENAYWDSVNRYAVITKPLLNQGGFLWYKSPVKPPFVIEFRYTAGGGTGAEGLVFLFNKMRGYEHQYHGGCLHFGATSSCTAPGYGIEFDEEMNGFDSSGDHIALIANTPSNHLAVAHGAGLGESKWHNVRISVSKDNVTVLFDGVTMIDYTSVGKFAATTYTNIGFSGTTGALTNNHLIDDVRLLQLTEPSLTPLPPAK